MSDEGVGVLRAHPGGPLDHGWSMGMALTSCVVPAAGKPTFDLPEDQMESLLQGSGMTLVSAIGWSERPVVRHHAAADSQCRRRRRHRDGCPTRGGLARQAGGSEPGLPYASEHEHFHQRNAVWRVAAVRPDWTGRRCARWCAQPRGCTGPYRSSWNYGNEQATCRATVTDDSGDALMMRENIYPFCCQST